MPPGTDDGRYSILQTTMGKTSDRAYSGDEASRQGRFLIVGFNQTDAVRVANAAAPWRTEVAEPTWTLRNVADWMEQGRRYLVGVIVAVCDRSGLAPLSDLWNSDPTTAVVTLGPPFGLEEMVDAFRIGVHEHVPEARIEELWEYLDRAAARARAMANLVEQRERLWALFNAMSGGAILSDRDGRILEMNAPARRYLKLSPNSGPSEVLCDNAVLELTRVLQNETVGEQSTVDIELRDGSRRRFGYSTTASPSGRFRVTLFRDLGPKLAFEHHIRRAEHLAQVGEMAARLSHEIKNPLASVLAGLELLAEQAPLDGCHGEVLREVTKEARALSLTVQELLSCMQGAPLNVKLSPVDAAVAEAVHSCRILASSKGVDLRLDTSTTTAAQALMDETWLRRALVNLIINAIEATGRGGKVEVSVGVLDEQQRRRLAGSFQGEVIVVRVRDDGPGLSREVAERIFEPFFTTKPTGTGLGLSVAVDVVESFGGVLTVTSRPGRGCRFDVYLVGRGALACWDRDTCDRSQCMRCPVYADGTGFLCWSVYRLTGGKSQACRRNACTRCNMYLGNNLRMVWQGPLVSFVEE